MILMIFVVCLNRDGRDSWDEPGFWWWLFGRFALVCGGGWGSPSGPSLPLALTPALSRPSGRGGFAVGGWRFSAGDQGCGGAGGFGLGSLYFCEGALRFLRGGWAVLERPLRGGGSWCSWAGSAGRRWFCGKVVWGFALVASFWPLPSPGPHPGPLPPSGRGGLLVAGGGFNWWSGVCGMAGWFLFGGSLFLRRALRFLRGGWAVLERPLRGGGHGVRGRGLWVVWWFCGKVVWMGECFWPRFPGIPRSPLASRPLASSTKGAVALPLSVAPFVLRTFPPRAGETLVFAKIP